ncbi:MAG TPA: flagellar export protein FliJ [Chloroflexota bacterium]|nr:flagellar export protein FliJ [Chloroflexota bacterium]
MSRFTFRLQTVLEHKQRLEELAQLDHAQAQAAQVREERSLGQLHDAEHRGFAELERQRFDGRLDIESLRFGMTYLDALKVQITRQEQVVDRVQRATETKREQLVGAMQDRKALDRLRQKQRTDFDRQQARREAADQDEMVVMRHRHSTGGTYA